MKNYNAQEVSEIFERHYEQFETLSQQVSHLALRLISNMGERELQRAHQDLMKLTRQNHIEYAFKKPLLYCINKRIMRFN